MKHYFGTDGIRGRAGEFLSAELALKACEAFATAARAQHGAKSARGPRPVVVLGRDPRLSSPMLAAAAAAGLMQGGFDVLELAIVPTPLVPFTLLKLKAAGGVMITASHNPVEDNGIKFFDADGMKLSAAGEAAIEKSLTSTGSKLKTGSASELGTQATYNTSADYLRYLGKALRIRGNGHTLRVVLDCAHGAACELAPKAFTTAGFEVETIHANFDGNRINVKCGSTDLSDLSRAVKKQRANLGLAFDGDGDRVLAVDERGNVVNGDRILALFATRIASYRKQGAVVMTQMTNLGVEQALAAQGVEVVRTEVGDIQVQAELTRRGLSLGGEQSGHIIMRDLSTSGDGILTGLRLALLLRKAQRPLSELAAQFPEYPQQLTNLAVRDKQLWRRDAKLRRELAELRRSYPEVRFYLRPSGTENLVRVLTESPDAGRCSEGNLAVVRALSEWNER